MTRWKNGKKNLDSKGNLTGGCHFPNLQHTCGDSSHLTESWGFRSGNEDLWEIVASSPFSPLPPAEASPLTCHSCMYFSWYPAKAELACRLQKIFCSLHTTAHFIWSVWNVSFPSLRHRSLAVTIFWSAMIVNWKCKTFLILFRSKINK